MSKHLYPQWFSTFMKNVQVFSEIVFDSAKPSINDRLQVDTGVTQAV